jgi:hypothetical protein
VSHDVATHPVLEAELPSLPQNKTTQWLEVFKIYPKADFNDARYPITNQVRRAGSYPSRWKESSNNLS